MRGREERVGRGRERERDMTQTWRWYVKIAYQKLLSLEHITTLPENVTILGHCDTLRKQCDKVSAL